MENTNIKESRISDKSKKILGIIAVIAFIAVSAVFCIFVGYPIMRFASQPELFREWVDQYGIWSRFGFMGMVLIQTFFAVIPGEPFEIAAGYAFGTLEGTLLCILASTVSSMIVFAFVRFFGVRLLEVFFSKEKIRSLGFLKSSPKRDILLFILFMLPGTPKDLLCYYAGVTDIKWYKWLLIVLIGRIPSIVTSTIGGDALGTKNYVFAAVVFGITLVISLGGLLIYRLISRRSEKKQV